MGIKGFSERNEGEFRKKDEVLFRVLRKKYGERLKVGFNSIVVLGLGCKH